MPASFLKYPWVIILFGTVAHSWQSVALGSTHLCLSFKTSQNIAHCPPCPPAISPSRLVCSLLLHHLWSKFTQVHCILECSTGGHSASLAPTHPSKPRPSPTSPLKVFRATPGPWQILSLTWVAIISALVGTQPWIIIGQFHVSTYGLTRQILSWLTVIRHLHDTVSPPLPSSPVASIMWGSNQPSNLFSVLVHCTTFSR